MKTLKESQVRKVARHLCNGYTITQREASRLYGCDRLAARIDDIKNGRFGVQPFFPKTTMCYKGNKKWAKYSYQKPAE